VLDATRRRIFFNEKQPRAMSDSERADDSAASNRAEPIASARFAAAASGDRVALEALLVRYFPHLHAFVRARLGPDADPSESSIDIVQSVCRQILTTRPLASFDGEERFRAWLFTSALNKIRQRHRHHHAGRRNKDRTDRAPDSASTAMASFLTPSQVAVGHETAAALAQALAALSEEHREVITLARLGDLPHRVIAEVTGRSEEAVRQMLGRALLRLVAELRARGVEVDRG
jgi:RNA polymerase sigma-70 factor (ECF subfamily)